MEDILGIGIGYVAILMPVLLIGVIFFFNTKNEKNKYDAMIEISQNIQDPSELRELLENLQGKKQPIDYRRSGVITLFIGLGIFLFGMSLSGEIVSGIGLLVGAIGAGSIVAGYLYPNDSAELTKAVEKFEE
ncbi:DUF6249 domain-containing protein [Gammaproteobacteria bacterium]|nr:DUF6249 domain-containing protein [Gammaproteobacteria bacterium]MDA9340567.1 DUF6249 domain-containing protein [Gammaproteobacteria bacterium]MDB9700994.1 DUF6249 domain-containing protein [Gammaproteobacteria bacterium]MDC0091839.1 DUF6249 domain-containing protein [Gammaproteobacteria bacterium]MDC1475686.1 DUF6249 domain-containing protein [Gammaproteobacteria bacterium]